MNNALCTGYESPLGVSRRQFLNSLGLGLGGIALADLVNPVQAAPTAGGVPVGLTHFAPKAKRPSDEPATAGEPSSKKHASGS